MPQPHPLVTQLRFTRSEFQRAMAGVSEEEAQRRFPPINSISWIVGHLAWHEQRCWLYRAQGKTLLPELNELTAYGKPASTPPLAEMWAAWNTITQAADPWLDTLTEEMLLTHPLSDGVPHVESIGTMMLRVTYHYWYHIGESQAIRQLLGHSSLPDFVGALGIHAPYVPESA